MFELTGLMVIAIVAVALYYGLGKNLEIGSRMVSRELEDAERLQKERIVRKYASRGKDDMSEANFKKATSHIQKIDDLDI